MVIYETQKKGFSKNLEEFGFEYIIKTELKNSYSQMVREKNKMERNFKKVDSGNIFKFEEVDEAIEGELMSKKTGGNYGNEIYKIKNPEGVVQTIFSTVVMEQQMETVNVGDYIKIVYKGEQDNKKKGQNPIKLFEVFAEEKKD